MDRRTHSIAAPMKVRIKTTTFRMAGFKLTIPVIWFHQCKWYVYPYFKNKPYHFNDNEFTIRGL